MDKVSTIKTGVYEAGLSICPMVLTAVSLSAQGKFPFYDKGYAGNVEFLFSWALELG